MPCFNRSALTTVPNAAATSGSKEVARLPAIFGLDGYDFGGITPPECQLCYVVGHGIYASPWLSSSATHFPRGALMTFGRFPASDLDRLAREVLGGPPEAALPHNLTDEWLFLISRDLDECLDGAEGEISKSSYMSAPLALVMHLLIGKGVGVGKMVTFEEFERYLADYRLEVGIELVSRRTDISINAATLSTIFEGREIEAFSAGSFDVNKCAPEPWASWDGLEPDCSPMDGIQEFEIERATDKCPRDPFSGWNAESEED
jgi:hypothetical protein